MFLAPSSLLVQVAFMFNEWYKPNSCLDFPVGGSQAMVDALVRCGGVTAKAPGAADRPPVPMTRTRHQDLIGISLLMGVSA